LKSTDSEGHCLSGSDKDKFFLDQCRRCPTSSEHYFISESHIFSLYGSKLLQLISDFSVNLLAHIRLSIRCCHAYHANGCASPIIDTICDLGITVDTEKSYKIVFTHCLNCA